MWKPAGQDILCDIAQRAVVAARVARSSPNAMPGVTPGRSATTPLACSTVPRLSSARCNCSANLRACGSREAFVR